MLQKLYLIHLHKNRSNRVNVHEPPSGTLNIFMIQGFLLLYRVINSKIH